MSYKEVFNHIRNNQLGKVYLFYGVEKYLIDWIISEIKNKYIEKTFESLNYIYLDGKETTSKDIINACETLPFMSNKKIVVIENPFFIQGNNQNEDELFNYMDNLNDMTCLIFIANTEKIDKRKKIIKKIGSIGSIIEFKKITGAELNKWIVKIFKKYSKKISKDNAEYFVVNSGYLENNSNKTLYDLENEIIKVTSYLGDRIEITKDDIDEVLVKSLQNNIFKLVDSIGLKDVKQALSIFNEMLLSNEPIQLIFHMITRQLRLLFMAKLLEMKGYSIPNIAQKMNVPNFVAKKIVQQSKNFTEKKLEEGLKECLKVDESIKKGSIDSKLAIEMLIVNFSK